MQSVQEREFYFKQGAPWLPDDLKKKLGLFNVFNFNPGKNGNPPNLPNSKKDYYKITLIKAFVRISTLFTELLERQFPIDDIYQPLNLRSASEYAENLNVHVNHLNRALKETSNKTTSQLVIDRILQEAKVLLRQSPWTVSEISYALGYAEVTHFNNLFKKYLNVTPTNYRKTGLMS